MNKNIENRDANSVSRVAYELWEKAGKPAGRDLEFWLAAEAQVRHVTTNGTGHQVEKELVRPAVKPARSSARAGQKKSWPKPYPSLPKF